MKNYVLALCSALLMVITSCKKDDDAAVSITGTWKPTKVRVSGTYQGVPVDQTVTMNTCQSQTRIVYNADGTGSETSWDDSTGTCTKTGPSSFTYSYNATAKTLTLTDTSGSTTANVSTLTATEMAIKGTQDYNGTQFSYEAFFSKQ